MASTQFEPGQEDQGGSSRRAAASDAIAANLGKPLGADEPGLIHRVWDIISTYSLLLVAGALLAIVWANLDPSSYHDLVHDPMLGTSPIGQSDGESVLTLHALVNDVLMALFFAIAGKEVWEAIVFEQGSLRGRAALVPVLCAVGGMVGPAAIHLGIVALLGQGSWGLLAPGWAVPTATDIAFSYVIARIVF